MRDLASLTPADFEAALGSPFQVVGADDHVVLVLSLARVVRHPARPSHRHPFSLYWTGPPTPVLRQLAYHLRHLEVGNLEIFRGPTAADVLAATYEAVFG